MKPMLRRMGWVVAAALALFVWLRSPAADAVVLPAMVGHWEGEARIVVSWCSQRSLRVAVDVHADGSVTGRLGDATLLHGRLERNRGWLGRRLHLATDYIIRGGLDGVVVAAEGIKREAVSIPLDWKGDKFEGGVHTSGTKFGGKGRMILSARSLTLRRGA